MRIKQNFSFDEKEDAEKILQTGFPNGIINYGSMQLVARYYRDVFGYGAVRLEREIIKFCTSQNPNFNAVTENDSVKKWIKNAMDYSLRKIDCIKITHSEMNKIKEITNLKNRKILYIMLILAKAKRYGGVKKNHLTQSDKFYINYSDFPDISRMASVNMTEVKLADVLWEFRELNLITIYNAEKETILLNYVSDTDPNIAITIDNPKRALEYYRVFFGGETIHCPDCGKEIVKKSGAHERCSECAKKAKKIKDSERIRIKRAVAKEFSINNG